MTVKLFMCWYWQFSDQIDNWFLSFIIKQSEIIRYSLYEPQIANKNKFLEACSLCPTEKLILFQIFSLLSEARTMN